ncbi:hypothetical protein RJ639_035684 [Escallonia herrerae]|uniref:Pescadillo homolog n=1 Tax=Escallonia herrerae TaxID=1293975 RepID=A0AA89BAE2_9ASTE|nr:hypothetical protein RJ639_035684 [Escallonia herrerae]
MPKHYRPPGKKKEGSAARYITRTHAVKYLQISLSLFRKLCILKGVFPRDPKKKVKGNHHTYYHLKDIVFLRHEPLLEKFREQRAYERKVKRALTKKNRDLAERLSTRRPSYTLDRLIRERYPKFVDALRDLDDCLSMAEIEGQKITWLTPHGLQQILPEDVDYKVMLTFLEFYETLLRFINFRLYQSINVNYPVDLDSKLESHSEELYASYNQSGALMHLVEHVAIEDEDDLETNECKALFKNVKFFLSREVPKESLEFVIPAFGGTFSWEGKGAPFKESDESITHQIVDRPTQGHKYLSRDYVQPQWIYDCVNARIILPIEEYLVGRVPPPHLSPFVDNGDEGYVPDRAEKIKRLQAAARKEVLPLPGAGGEDLDDPNNLLIEGIIDRAQAIEAAERKQKMSALQKQYHDELIMELQGVQKSSVSNLSNNESAENGGESVPDLQQIAEDAANMPSVMMSRKKRGLLKAMQIGKERKRARVELLEERKKKIQANKSEKSA